MLYSVWSDAQTVFLGLSTSVAPHKRNPTSKSSHSIPSPCRLSLKLSTSGSPSPTDTATGIIGNTNRTKCRSQLIRVSTSTSTTTNRSSTTTSVGKTTIRNGCSFTSTSVNICSHALRLDCDLDVPYYRDGSVSAIDWFCAWADIADGCEHRIKKLKCSVGVDVKKNRRLVEE
ncbi:hypothetical protein HO173_008035 [Letharia columbiana]|uniref:Uncharacterized protein n=1 Tax=Letharia columbiana TaxID=112416 RepID=A0A8H6FSA3_9LECA|nr:uncharacterized protein HO173_008035 [Letharia columbiana]KAF6233823.1 hypothetical protein HO173_008035 [Letharia columbiana]